MGAQYESEVVYHNLRDDLAKQGVLFLDTDSALKEQPEIFKIFTIMLRLQRKQKKIGMMFLKMLKTHLINLVFLKLKRNS